MATPSDRRPGPLTPPDLDEVRRLLRPRIADIPQVLAAWARGEGPLADVPLLDPSMVAPRAFAELSGTVRVAATSAALVTVAGLLELPVGGVLVTAMAVSPADLAIPPDVVASRRVLAEQGATSTSMSVEVAALLSPMDDSGEGPAAGVGIVRPLVLADPASFPHPEDPTPYGEELIDAARAAVAEDREVVVDLGGPAMSPIPADLARIWSPMFEVARAATIGLAARGAGIT